MEIFGTRNKPTPDVSYSVLYHTLSVGIWNLIIIQI